MSKTEPKSVLDALRIAFGNREQECLVAVREDVFGDIAWVAAGGGPDADGWLIRCNEGGVLAMAASNDATKRIVTRLETVLTHPEYDDALAMLDGFSLDAVILRGDEEAWFEASTAKVDVRLVDWVEKLFDLPRDALEEVLAQQEGDSPL